MSRPLLFVPGKKDYVRGRRPAVECILCAARSGDPRVASLVVAEDMHVFITLNLFPYNPGHVMIVPRRHVVDPRELRSTERGAIDAWTLRLLDVLDRLYQPSGYNIGYNLGQSSGASIAHLHLHVVPRFRNEIGFIDVLSGARVHVDDPAEAVKRLRRALRPRPARPVGPAAKPRARGGRARR